MIVNLLKLTASIQANYKPHSTAIWLPSFVFLTGSNKLVGIISHREELMENIPQQIKVKKTKDGSQITVERGV